jgi:hypothetical protein
LIVPDVTWRSPSTQPAPRTVPAVWLAAMLAWWAGPGTAPAPAHVAWPTYHSAKTSIAAEEERLRIAVVVEIPLPDLVLAFNQHFAHLDLLAEIEKGRVEELEEEFRRGQFEEMARALAVEIDGKPANGRFRAADTPINGRATEGFFVYVLEYAFERPPKLPRRLEITVRNRLYQGVDMVFANHVEARGGWRVVSTSTPQPPAGADLTVGSPEEAAMWSEDESRREFRVVLDRAPAPGGAAPP